MIQWPKISRSNARTHTPQKTKATTSPIEKDCPGNLLCHPGPLEPAIKAIGGNTWLERDFGLARESQFGQTADQASRQNTRP